MRVKSPQLCDSTGDEIAEARNDYVYFRVRRARDFLRLRGREKYDVPDARMRVPRWPFANRESRDADDAGVRF